MSGRSAYVRKKITETNAAEGRQAKSVASSDGASTIGDHSPMRPYFADRLPDRNRDRDITGIGTTNSRFLKFSEPAREVDPAHYRGDTTGYNQSSESHSSDSFNGRQQNGLSAGRPLDDFAYARARKPVIKTEDVSGIEKSSLRNLLDKKSDDVRKGLIKTFTFNKRRDRKESDLDRTLEHRPHSSATINRGESRGGELGRDQDLDFGTQEIRSGGASNITHTDESWGIPSMPAPPPSTQLPPIPATPTTIPIKRWIGSGRPVQRWNKLRKDPELWDPNGDVLVFLGHKDQNPRPNPSFRLSSHIIEATQSRVLITLLRDGSTEEDVHLSAGAPGAPPLLQRHDLYLSPYRAAQAPAREIVPAASNEASLTDADGQVSYELYFPPLANANKLEQLRHHITTRNVFALLSHASLVGLSLYQALSDLRLRLEAYMPVDADNVSTILDYISARGIDDVRNEPETAVSLLAWSESADVHWEEGWREAFLHCAGMYSRLEGTADFARLTPITRALLERASLETQLRVQAAEERLGDFEFDDMWPESLATLANTSGPVVAAPAKMAAMRLQKFFVRHYANQHGRWPPLPPTQDQHAVGAAYSSGDDDELWLTRTVAQSLQQDFAALYEYLVNRDIVWDKSEARSSRKWMLVSKSGATFTPDTSDLPMTDLLIEFDNKLRFPHIPHPYPLVPEAISDMAGTGSANTVRRDNAGNIHSGRHGKRHDHIINDGRMRTGPAERRIQLAYADATNICSLSSSLAQSDLTEAFAKFEKGDRLDSLDPSVGRRGRWVLIYGILQTLASVSVDTPNVRYRDGVDYHLSPRLNSAKMPPWRSGGGSGSPPVMQEVSHELSHCWRAPLTWTASNPNSAAESSSDESPRRVRRDDAYSFPRPPTSVAGSQVNTSYHTPAGTRAPSALSSSYATPSMYGGHGSLVSGTSVAGSDAGSSVQTPRSSVSGRVRSRALREGKTGAKGAPWAPRGVHRLAENDWKPLGARMPEDAGLGSFQLGPLGNLTGTGGFLNLDDVDESGRSGESFVDLPHATAPVRPSTAKETRQVSRPILGGSASSETESVAPVIRDFDDFASLDGHGL